MSGGPNFDELIGEEPSVAERDRLRRAHELLLRAGPPPELPPRLEKTPQVDNLFVLPRRIAKRPATLLFAAALAVAAVFFGGYAVGHRNSAGASQALAQYKLQGTPAAPGAQATLDLLPATAGNWPMTLHVSGLQKLPQGSLYEVLLVRGSKVLGSCGTFIVSNPAQAISVPLNAPYRLARSDTWIVTRETPSGGIGPTVLKPKPVAA